MIKAIVYKSCTGFTEKYAHMLAKLIQIPAYKLEDSHLKLHKKDEVIYMGSIYGRKLNKLKQASKKYNIKMIAAVGMSFPQDKIIKELKEDNNIDNIPVFYLQGGMNKEKLKGLKKFMIGCLEKGLSTNKEKDPLYEVIKDNKDFVSEENLKPIENWYKKYLIENNTNKESK